MKLIDISKLPELVRIAEEVRDSKESCLLRRDGEDIAVVMPIPPVSNGLGLTKTKAEYEAFRSAAGGWSDVDTDKLIADIYADREASDRPRVDL